MQLLSLSLSLSPKSQRRLNSLELPIVFISCFTLAFILASLIWIPRPSTAITGLILAPSAPSISLYSSPSIVAIDLLPAPTGTLSSNSHSVITNTDVPSGYNLSLLLSSTPTPTLPPSPATLASPTALPANTWGYNISGSSTLFSGATLTPTTIKTTNQSTTANPGTSSTQVHYGVRADISVPVGTYSSTITYSVTTNTSTLPQPTILSITPTTGTTAGATSVQIVGTGFTGNDQSITTGVTLDNQACTNVSISSNSPVVGQDTIYCTTPTHPAAATVNLKVDTWGGTITRTGAYTFIAPTVTISAPTQGQIFTADTTTTTLTATTNIPAICYYGPATNPTIQMSTTGGTSHSQSITALANQSTNTRYVRCTAATGHSYSTPTTGNTLTFYVRATTPVTPTTAPASNSTVSNGTTTIIVTSSTPGAVCAWGTSSGSYPNASGTTRTTITGTNTLYYSCTVSSGNTQSISTTGSWSYIGINPTPPYAGIIQTITTANCPTILSYARDARDNATYLVQKLADNRCWMLTNLAYGGGGTNTYGDIKAITLNSTSSGSSVNAPQYYVPPSSNRTTGTTIPSTSTDGGATNPQYGYLYNWCAAMGGQTGTAACERDITPVPNQNISICPAGWRLPTSDTGGEFEKLTTAIGGGSTIISTWLGMYSGIWYNGFSGQGNIGYHWSSIVYPNSITIGAYVLRFNSVSVSPSGVYPKDSGYAVRCIAT